MFNSEKSIDTNVALGKKISYCGYQIWEMAAINYYLHALKASVFKKSKKKDYNYYISNFLAYLTQVILNLDLHKTLKRQKHFFAISR